MGLGASNRKLLISAGPTLIATQNALGVGPSSDALLFVICSPVGPYYASEPFPFRYVVPMEERETPWRRREMFRPVLTARRVQACSVARYYQIRPCRSWRNRRIQAGCQVSFLTPINTLGNAQQREADDEATRLGSCRRRKR